VCWDVSSFGINRKDDLWRILFVALCERSSCVRTSLFTGEAAGSICTAITGRIAAHGHVQLVVEQEADG
jgi:hypothetical protein